MKVFDTMSGSVDLLQNTILLDDGCSIRYAKGMWSLAPIGDSNYSSETTTSYSVKVEVSYNPTSGREKFTLFVWDAKARDYTIIQTQGESDTVTTTTLHTHNPQSHPFPNPRLLLIANIMGRTVKIFEALEFGEIDILDYLESHADSDSEGDIYHQTKWMEAP
ncbi:hypothetical protein M422DRAFT_68422 [Sphaerobolus stellatus SS14]|uniref:Unplaced genomic scaffold SPHSTscaffold_65, whole genome shotgun sequence n=1 Tax=Sphaerobolus stellatus (strain SS14) TaxID=990650 RepID=A0A0C9V1J1_SPHS4|nr:hypothetical protein M422DRAFT_68422 [Sphaerobolus stellatus SS14]